MRTGTRSLFLALLIAGAPAFGLANAQTAGAPVRAPQFLELPHANGTLALRTSQIASVWYRPAAADKASQIRIVSPALSEAKTIASADADALWQTVHDGSLAPLFVFASHMDGTLAIPRDQIRTAFYTGQGADAQLRLVYEGDPSGKAVTGAEATRIWEQLTG